MSREITIDLDVLENMALEGRILPEYETACGTLINTLCSLFYHRSRIAGWWSNKDGSPKERNKGEMLMLMVSEIAEAMEGERKHLMDDHLKSRPMPEVEMADVSIRQFDYCGGFGYNLGEAIFEKSRYNETRADHKLENRNAEGGKDF